jgi:hypothetical protein
MRADMLRRIEGGTLQKVVGKHHVHTEKLRSSVLSRIAHPKTTDSLQEIRRVFTPSFARMMELRAEVLDRIVNWQPIPEPLWHRSLKPIAITAALVMVLRIAPTFFIATPLQASSESMLMPAGFVSITDGAEWSIVEEQLKLTQGGTVRTGNESSATILLGDRLLRLGENTEVNVLDTAFDPESTYLSPIARVIYGQVWVTSLFPEALFAGTTVSLPQGTLALKKGSVNVYADPQQTTVQVFYGFAHVAAIGDDPVDLIQGDQLTLNPKSYSQHVITESLRKEEWVQSNLSKDAVHRMEVAEKQQELAEASAGILSDSIFYSLKLGSEALDLGFTLSAKARQEKRLQHAQTRLNEAVTLIHAGKTDAAKEPLAAYRETIRSFASITEEEARALLNEYFVTSSATVSSALPHSDLYIAKEEVLKAATESAAAGISTAEVDLFLLTDALLGIQNLIEVREFVQAGIVFNGIEKPVASVLANQELGETVVEKNTLKAIKATLRAMVFSLDQAVETTSPEEVKMLSALKDRITLNLPQSQTTLVVEEPQAECMALREELRLTNRILSDIYSHVTSRGQRNRVLYWLAHLPECQKSSSRILVRIMNKVPVYTRSFVWEALQKLEAEI